MTERRYSPTLRDLPRRTVWLFLLSFFGASLLGGVYLYADNAYPHGPCVFTGQFEERCQAERRCRDVPVYREDTSQLDNPAWVTAVRTLGILIAGPGILLGIVAFNQGATLRAAWIRTGRTLAVLQYLSEGWNPYETEKTPSLVAWRIWDARARVLTNLGEYAEALESKYAAKLGEVWELRSDRKAWEQGITLEDEVSWAEDRHDRDIAAIRSLEAEANPPK